MPALLSTTTGYTFGRDYADLYAQHVMDQLALRGAGLVTAFALLPGSRIAFPYPTPPLFIPRYPAGGWTSAVYLRLTLRLIHLGLTTLRAPQLVLRPLVWLPCWFPGCTPRLWRTHTPPPPALPLVCYLPTIQSLRCAGRCLLPLWFPLHRAGQAHTRFARCPALARRGLLAVRAGAGRLFIVYAFPFPRCLLPVVGQDCSRMPRRWFATPPDTAAAPAGHGLYGTCYG